jgi:hypothetical protein
MSGRFEDRLKGLKELPEIAPPARVEARTLAAMGRAACPPRRFALAKAAVWVVAIGAAALVAGIALDTGREVEKAPADDEAYAAEDEYFELLVASLLLEETLQQLPPPRRVMRVSTAGTVVALEDRIALIDAAFERALAESDPPEYRTVLLRDRVDAMNALVNVRYAQSRAFTF